MAKHKFVLLALVRKSAELKGKLQEIEERKAHVEEDIASVDASIRLFAPEFNLDAIKPVRKRKKRAPRPQGTTRRILEILRTASEPLTVRQIMEHMPEDTCQHSVRTTLVAQAKRRVLERVGKVGNQNLWRVAQPQAAAGSGAAEVIELRTRCRP